MPQKLQTTKSMRCPTHGRVAAVLTRGPYTSDDEVIDDVAGYACPHCQRVLAVAQQASGRIAAAIQGRSAAPSRDFRVPREVEDLALAVNAHFGVAGIGETFTLPIHLGLRLVGDLQMPDAAWRVFDADEKPVRARPRIHQQTMQRLEGLANLWKATPTDVARWLVVAAYDAVTAGLEVAAPVREEQVFNNVVQLPTATMRVVEIQDAVQTSPITNASYSRRA